MRLALKEHLGSHGIPVDDMVEAGLLVAGDDIPVPYDRFRDRVMFPIGDRAGRVIAFGGRTCPRPRDWYKISWVSQTKLTYICYH